MQFNTKPVIHTGIILFFACLITLVPCRCRGDAVSPRDGGALPPGVLKLMYGTKERPVTIRGWSKKGREEEREVGWLRSGSVADERGGRVVAGNLVIPVAPLLYSDVEFPPVERDQLEQELFTGPWPDGTLSEYYCEVSRGKLNVSGTVMEWSRLPRSEAYYSGTIIEPPRMGELIEQTLQSLDPGVDFGQFDNDGPDNIPNSGDDDGYVDVLVLVHPSRGAECGNNLGIWSHSSSYSLFSSDGLPYSTGDAAAGGGNILVDDYMICPALSCRKPERVMIEIGVFCHELGHTLGLPDLYDYNGGGTGIGHWGLMGAGNWNTPSSPAHPCAWSKEQMGWLEPLEAGWQREHKELESSNLNGKVMKMHLPTRRFRRRDVPGSGSNYALVCGYTAGEAEGRNWVGGAGYGNMWCESMSRSFQCGGNGDLQVRYRVVCDLEENYDFGYLLMERGGATDTLARYTGRVDREEILNIPGPVTASSGHYSLRFMLLTDYNFSDSDGGYDSDPGRAFMIDNLSLSSDCGDWNCDFEQDAGGWRNDSGVVEYFLVENRQNNGFDRHLHGEGLLIWHVESSIAYSYLGNSGGFSNQVARGVVLEERDGRFDLISSYYPDLDYGDNTDPFRGNSGGESFNSTTAPSSRDNSGDPTLISVEGIRSFFDIASASFRGGIPPPVVEYIEPDTIERLNGLMDTLDLWGKNFAEGSSCRLVAGDNSVECVETVWSGPAHISAVIDREALWGGSWGVELTGPDGQKVEFTEGVYVNSAFLSAVAEGGGDYIKAGWRLKAGSDVTGCLVKRSAGDGPFRVISPDTLVSDDQVYSYADYRVVPGVRYSYAISALFRGGGEEEITIRGDFAISTPPYVYPNPFNGTATIGFYVPRNFPVSIRIYDVAGRRMKDFGKRIYPRGMHRVTWTPRRSEVSPGVYFCHILTGEIEDTIKIIYLR